MQHYLLLHLLLAATADVSFHLNDLSHTHPRIVHPRLHETHRWHHKKITRNLRYLTKETLQIVELGPITLELTPEGSLIVEDDLSSAWIGEKGQERQRETAKCDHRRGVVRGARLSSTVGLSLCGHELTGYIGLGERVYLVEPLGANVSGDNPHVLVEGTLSRRRRASEPDPAADVHEWEFFNLTGDVIDIGPSDIELDRNEDVQRESSLFNVSLPRRVIEWRREEVDTDLGYFYDTAWEPDPVDEHNNTEQSQKPPLWLKVAVAVDYTVINFHGRDRVEKYVLALMNIVNAIYQDSSLDANIQLVLTRMLFYEHRKQSVVRPGNAKKSLENVNGWNRRLHASMAPGETHHDVAVWLTRSDIGGPSGYAPIGGTCDPKRSCALNRDEGLTSAFIIAHEMAHIMGLSHDGESKAGNNCVDEAADGSVMAPMVSATFHKFTWSKCSQEEFVKNSGKWKCLSTQPPSKGNIFLNATLQNAFTMDEQCRMEFGEGYSLCRGFDIVEPCSHLWCGHVDSPLVCKTKKGPPLEGTDCGFDKWCIEGYCQDVDTRRLGMEPVIHNPQNGGWGEWSEWGACSRSCGTGVSFRTRKCDNPSPAYGGSDCFGLPEEWRLCSTNPCPPPLGDIRAEQCARLPAIIDFTNSSKSGMQWLPYESEEHDMKCKLICISQNSRELFITDEDLIDGTPCSYENSTNICIQGTCHPFGCDGKLFSPLKVDSCGTCGGNNTDCTRMTVVKRKKLKREVSRVAVIPRMAREIRFEANATMEVLLDPLVAFILKNRRKKRYTVTIPNTGFHTEIVEGTKFYYKKYRSKHIVWAKGPVLAELLILIYAPKSSIDLGLNISSRIEYYTHNDSFVASKRYRWIVGGWGPCSASCGGGRRHHTVACWDDDSQKIVRKKHCSLMTKPGLASEKCNAFSCNFHWVAGDWEPCSATCGSTGLQHRELYCVPQSVLNTTNQTAQNEHWRSAVSPAKCSGTPPFDSRPCNRIPCLSRWVYDSWSQCSTSCGKGFSFRTPHCLPPEGESFYTCDSAPRTERRRCRGAYSRRTHFSCRNRKRGVCHGDESRYCSLALLAKYCALPGFGRLCCKSCAGVKLTPVSF